MQMKTKKEQRNVKKRKEKKPQSKPARHMQMPLREPATRPLGGRARNKEGENENATMKRPANNKERKEVQVK